MYPVVTLALKDLRLLAREPMAVFWSLIFPLVFALFFGTIFGGSGGRTAALVVAVVDEDDSDGSRAFVRRLEESKALRVERTDRATAREVVRKGNKVGYVVLGKGFGEASPFAGPQGPSVTVGMDPARQAEAGYLQGLLMEAAAAGMQDLFADPKKAREQVHKSFEQLDRAEGLKPQQRQNLKEFLEMMEEAMGKFDPQLARKGGVGFQPVLITKEEVTTERTGPRSPWEVTFPSAVLWGMLGCVTGFSISLVSERVGGTWLRLQTAPVSRSQVLAGKGLACFLACALVTGLLLTIGRQVLGVGIENYPALVLGAACTAFCFTGIMMFLCTLGKTERAVAGIGWGAMMPLAMIGGGMIPLFVMPAWLQTASHFSPVKWGIVALEGPIWRGYGLADMLLPCGILAAVGAAGFGVGMAWLSRQEG